MLAANRQVGWRGRGQPYMTCITVSEQSVNNLSNCITCVGCCNFLHNPNFLTVAAKFKDTPTRAENQREGFKGQQNCFTDGKTEALEGITH